MNAAREVITDARSGHPARPAPEFEGVLGSDIPREGTHIAAAARYDHPIDAGWPDARFSLRLIAIEMLADYQATDCAAGRHGAHCYTTARFLDMIEGKNRHEIAEPDWADDATVAHRDESDYVKAMAATPEALPVLVLRADIDRPIHYGGNHRLAAWQDAGYTHVPCWVPDPLLEAIA
ncbi:ParB N-terminal domain-containing protein [Mycobacteroides abscessus]|uniref:hypothetical protein n=1 Tax=Mycobacteroides abscessus TaxID=36809 RepID=UPI0010553820|nr:hypothetical protein [Mycobacteroides abscessus]